MICVQCGYPIKMFYTETEIGPMHTACMAELRPYVPKEDFLSVLTNTDDQVLMRRILLEYVPEEIQRKVIESFNRLMQERRERRMQVEKWPESIEITEDR